jgi:rhodanese-related sulfurtransferase
MTETKPEVLNADVAQVKAWLDRNEILLVDVRETSEYEKEHIAGSVLLPLSSFEPDMFPSLPGKKVVLHCAVGKRSEAAGKMLLNEGYPTITHMVGGLAEWKAAGYATEVQILPGGCPVCLQPRPLGLEAYAYVAGIDPFAEN